MTKTSSPDDPQLVELTNGLCQQLEISGLDIKDVRWWGPVPTARLPSNGFSDWCQFTKHSIIIPVHMIGILTVDEWRPLIASSLLFEKKLKGTLNGRLTMWLGTSAIMLAGPLIAAALLRAVWIAGLYVVTLILAIFLLPRLYYPSVKRARLAADVEASTVVGRDALLEVLKKMLAMGLWDVDRREVGKYVRASGWQGTPTITQRINNLQPLTRA